MAYFNEKGHELDVQEAVAVGSIAGCFVLGALVLLYGGLRYAGRNKPAAPVDSTPTTPSEATV